MDRESARAAVSRLCQHFPERQIFIRSEGRVQFYSLSPKSQLLLFLLLLVFVSWVSFVSANVIFKDWIIAAADHRYEQLQEGYEDRLAESYRSFESLNASVAAAEIRARSKLAAAQKRQAWFYQRMDLRNQNISPRGLAESGPMPGIVFSSSRIDAVTRQAAKGLFGIIARLAHRSALVVTRTGALHADIHNPLLRMLEENTLKLDMLGREADLTMRSGEASLLRAIERRRETIARIGLPPDELIHDATGEEGVGGPEIPLSEVHLQGISDQEFTQSYLQAGALLSQLSDISSIMNHIPVAAPVDELQAHPSSGFGPRLDPFTGRYSFHPGLDFSGPIGTAISATALGYVVFAGSDGTYGNMVEIDHGYSLHTRYAHLSRIAVSTGMRLPKGAIVGWLGTTGRSTGPHLHYEVWYDRAARDPGRFIGAR